MYYAIDFILILKPMHVRMSIYVCRKQDSWLVYGTKTDSLTIRSFKKQCFCFDRCDFFFPLIEVCNLFRFCSRKCMPEISIVVKQVVVVR